MAGKKYFTLETSAFNLTTIDENFSRCSVKVLYLGENRNNTFFTKESVEKALPSLRNMPVVGEWIPEKDTFGSHGGKIEITDSEVKFKPTTRPYGTVDSNFRYEWEKEELQDGTTRTNLIIHDVILWTKHYEEASKIVSLENSQSMEIEAIDGEWDEELGFYVFKDFTFLSLCVLGKDVEPCFENSRFYSLDKDSFKKEFSLMLKELKKSLAKENFSENKNEEVGNMNLKELLEKYSTTVEELTAKGLNFNELSEDELESKIKETLGEKDASESEEKEEAQDEKSADEAQKEEQAEEQTEEAEDAQEISKEDAQEAQDTEEDKEEQKDVQEQEDAKEEEQKQEVNEDHNEEFAELQSKIKSLEEKLEKANSELEKLRGFKLNVEKKAHEEKAKKLFSNFQFTEEDVKDLDVHKFTIEELEEKCYAIFGKKLASKKNFAKTKEENNGIHLPFGNENFSKNNESPYGDLFEKYSK